MATSKELLDELLKDCKRPEDLLGKNGVLKQLTEGPDGAHAGGGDDGSSRLRQACSGRPRQRQLADGPGCELEHEVGFGIAGGVGKAS